MGWGQQRLRSRPRIGLGPLCRNDFFKLQQSLVNRLRPHAAAWAVKVKALAADHAIDPPAQPHGAHRLVWATAVWPGNAGAGHGNGNLGVQGRAVRHSAHNRLADGTVRGDQFGRYAKQLRFGGIGIGDKAALKPAAGAGDVGASGGNQATGAAFGTGQHPAALLQLLAQGVILFIKIKEIALK